MNKTEAAVARGMALLDEQNTGWVDDIRVISLDLSNTEDCVLGQLYGNYYVGCRRLYSDEFTSKAIRDGFVISNWYRLWPPLMEAKYEELSMEWRHAISARRLAAWREEAREAISKVRS